MSKRLARRHCGIALEAVCIVGCLTLLLLVVGGGDGWLASLRDRPDGDELLFYGIKGSQPMWVDEALARGASVNARDANGMTPLMCAADVGNENLVRRLLGAGADISARSTRGWTALAKAAAMGHTSVMQFLIAAGAPVDQRSLLDGTALHIAAALGQEQAVQTLLESGADPLAVDGDGKTAAERGAEADYEQLAAEIHCWLQRPR